jgi:hypothetical protein
MIQKLTLRKWILITGIIAILVVAFVGAAIVYKQMTTTKLSVTISSNQTSILQGNSAKIPVTISLTGNPENIELTSAVNSSKINCFFDRTNGSSSFDNTLTVNVNDSAQGGNYSVTVSASSSTTSANASCIITVLARNVTVSGKINIHWTVWTMRFDSLMFEDSRTGEKVTVPISKEIYEGNVNFTVDLKNQDFYNVTANYYFGIEVFYPFGRSDVIGNLTVSTPDGSNMMPGQDFTLTPGGR